jgi:hypothetical protein
VGPGAAAELRDVALTAALAPVQALAPAFQIDWKEPTDAERHFGIIDPPRELRVRTQIETEKRRAREANLFAYRMLAPRVTNPGGAVDEYEWLAEIHFHGIDAQKRPQVKTQLAKLLQQCGVPGVGKLKTRCVAALDTIEPPVGVVSEKGAHRDVWVVTLQTPGLLCDVAQLGPGLTHATDVYRGYWLDISGGCLQLERHFASQTLAGGGYLWRQFRPHNPYRPYVLTLAGSTFVLKRAQGKPNVAPEDCLATWQRTGLPVAKTVRDAFQLKGDASDWHRCPYVPENGFGEIAVDQVWHWERAL